MLFLSDAYRERICRERGKVSVNACITPSDCYSLTLRCPRCQEPSFSLQQQRLQRVDDTSSAILPSRSESAVFLPTWAWCGDSLAHCAVQGIEIFTLASQNLHSVAFKSSLHIVALEILGRVAGDWGSQGRVACQCQRVEVGAKGEDWHC